VKRYFPPGLAKDEKTRRKPFEKRFREFEDTARTEIGAEMAARMYYYTFLERLDE